MPQCQHHHQQADTWTNIATVGEASASFISDAYWLGTLFDITSGCAVETLGLSFYGLGFGAIMALLSASGAAYSHRTLNTHHQPKHNQEPVDSKNGELQQYSTISIVENKGSINDGQPLPSHKHTHLTVLQKLALVGDFVSHVGDIAGPLTFVVNLATNNSLSRWGKVLAQCGASLFGGISTVANVRTCKDAMIMHQHEQASTPLLKK